MPYNRGMARTPLIIGRPARPPLAPLRAGGGRRSPRCRSRHKHLFLRTCRAKLARCRRKYASARRPVQELAYDAYGNNLGFDPAAALTTFLYSGEQFDQRIEMQYLRARYFDAAAGTFNRLDPFFGRISDPQSLHKYVYAHNDPANRLDPSGEFIISLAISMGINSKLRSADAKAKLGVYWYALRFTSTLVRYGGGLYELMCYLSFGHAKWGDSVRKHVTGTGGRDITSALTYTADELVTWWDENLSDQESDDLTTFTFANMLNQNSMYSFSGWDVFPLNEEQTPQQAAFAADVADWAPRSVTVDRNVYYAHEVNYFFWGVAHALAAQRQTSHARSLTKEKMLGWVMAYRQYAGDAANIATAHDGSKYGRAAWAAAGWDYIVTGSLSPPTDYRLPNATANGDVYIRPHFEVQYGSHFPSNDF